MLPFFTTGLELGGTRLSEMSGRERQMVDDITYKQNLKSEIMKTAYNDGYQELGPGENGKMLFRKFRPPIIRQIKVLGIQCKTHCEYS